MCCNPLSAAGSCSAPQPRSAEAKAAACDCAAHPLPRGVGTAQAPYLGCGPAKTSLGHATTSGILRRLRLTMGRVVRYCFGGTVGVVERYYCGGTAGELLSSHRLSWQTVGHTVRHTSKLQVGACGLALQSLPPADSARPPPIPLSSRRPLRTAQTTNPCFVSIPSLFWMP